MLDLVQRAEFWVAMVAATILKFKASPPVSPLSAVLTVIAGVCSAAVFTEPLAAYLSIDGQNVKYAIAGLVMLTAEHVSRQVLTLSLSDFFKTGKGK